jgi:hypothetical protein
MSTLMDSFKKLNIPFDSTEEEVKAAYRKLSHQEHPDKPDGQTEDQKSLNKAYEMAKQAAKSGTSMLIIETSNALEVAKRALVIQQENIKTNLLVDRVKRKRTSQVRMMRDTTLVMGLFSGVFALIKTNLLPVAIDPNIKEAFGMVAFGLGAFAAFCQFYCTNIKNRIDDHIESLSDKSKCAKELARTLNYTDLSEFSENDYFGNYNGQNDNRRSSYDMLNITLQKSIEHSLVELVETDGILKPNQDKNYLLNKSFKPSLFVQNEL